MACKIVSTLACEACVAEYPGNKQYNLQPAQRSAFLSLRLQTLLKKGNNNSLFSYSLAQSNLIVLRKLSSTAISSEKSGQRTQESQHSCKNFVVPSSDCRPYDATRLAVTTITNPMPAQLSDMPSPRRCSSAALHVEAVHSTNTPNLKNTISNRLTEFLIEKELNPFLSYEDLQLDEVKKKISFETRNLSGVYMVLNKVTLDFYIGSASTGKIYSRFYRHLISFNGSKIVKFAVKKYKLTSFAFLILELFPEIVTKENNNKLIALEDFYLKTLLPNYNILTEAGSSFGYKHTEITRLNMSKFYSQALLSTE